MVGLGGNSSGDTEKLAELLCLREVVGGGRVDRLDGSLAARDGAIGTLRFDLAGGIAEDLDTIAAKREVSTRRENEDEGRELTGGCVLDYWRSSLEQGGILLRVNRELGEWQVRHEGRE